MGVANVPLRSPARLTYAVVIGCLLGPRCAMAFPASDPSNPSVESDIPPPTDADLRHQLQLQSGFGAGAAGAGGWSFVPRVSLQEMYTDNVLQTSNNRRWDLVTLFTPGFSLLGDVPNAQVKLDYGPELREDLRTPQEDGVTQQLLGTGLFTLVPDELFVDARAVAGGTPNSPGFGASGNIAPQATSEVLVGSMKPACQSRTRHRSTASRSRLTCCTGSATLARPRLATSSMSPAFPMPVTMLSRCSFSPAVVTSRTLRTRAWLSSKLASGLPHSVTSCWRM